MLVLSISINKIYIFYTTGIYQNLFLIINNNIIVPIFYIVSHIHDTINVESRYCVIENLKSVVIILSSELSNQYYILFYLNRSSKESETSSVILESVIDKIYLVLFIFFLSCVNTLKCMCSIEV